MPSPSLLLVIVNLINMRGKLEMTWKEVLRENNERMLKVITE